MTPKPDYILDLASLPNPQSPPTQSQSSPPNKNWLAIHWKCCHTYSRIYRNKEQTAYQGRCPVCGKFARALIGPDGQNSRFFTAE